AMAIRGMLPAWFAKMHPKYHTPSNAIIFLTVLAFLAPLLGRQALNWLVNAGSIGVVLGYLIVTLAFLQLRKLEPELERPYSVKCPISIGLLAILLFIFFLSFYSSGFPAQLTIPIASSLVLAWYLIGASFNFMHKA